MCADIDDVVTHWRASYLIRSRKTNRSFLYFYTNDEADRESISHWLSTDNPSPMVENIMQRWLDRMIQSKAFEVAPKRGDFIQLGFLQYRNDGLYIIDSDTKGALVVRDLLYHFAVDDYGAIPPNFDLDGFTPRYFNDIIGRNSFVWVPKNYDQEIKNNMEYGRTDHLYNDDVLPAITERFRPYSYFICNGVRIDIIAVTKNKKYPESFTYDKEYSSAFQSFENMIKYLLRGSLRRDLEIFRKPHNYPMLEPRMFSCDDPVDGSEQFLKSPETTIFIQIAW